MVDIDNLVVNANNVAYTFPDNVRAVALRAKDADITVASAPGGDTYTLDADAPGIAFEDMDMRGRTLYFSGTSAVLQVLMILGNG